MQDEMCMAIHKALPVQNDSLQLIDATLLLD